MEVGLCKPAEEGLGGYGGVRALEEGGAISREHDGKWQWSVKRLWLPREVWSQSYEVAGESRLSEQESGFNTAKRKGIRLSGPLSRAQER